MGGVFTLSAEDPGFEPRLVQTRLLVFASFQLSTQNSGARAKTGCLGMWQYVYLHTVVSLS